MLNFFSMLVISSTQAINESPTVMLCVNDLTPGYLMNVLCVSSGSSLPPPVLTVFPPSSAELQSNKASLVCLSSQSVPFADVSWLLGGSPVSSGISTSTAVQQADQTFQISSYLAVQTSDWNMDKVYTCVSGVTVVTQKPPVVTLRKGETATMDCNLGTDVDAAKVLTQMPAVHTVSTGQEAVLNCNIQRYDGKYVRWYKQVPGEAPQFVLEFLYSNSALNFGSGFSSDRFNSKSSSNIDYQFIIKRTETGDSAVYYCSSLPPPVLTVFPPSSAELQSNKASLVCLSSQSVPFADVSWLLGGSPVSSGISTSTAVQQADQTFQISSYLAVQTSDWNMDKVYTCVSGVTVVTQKPPVVTLRKGETATMDCNLGTVTNTAVWYKQIPGGVPQYVLRFYHSWSSVEYGSGFSSPKFTSNHQSRTDYRVSGVTAVTQKPPVVTLRKGETATMDCNLGTGVSGVTVVTQKPPVVTLRNGETATMDCNLGCVTDSAAFWYKQIPGGVPQHILKFRHTWSSVVYGSGFSSSKFTSNHQSKTDYRLIISNVEEGDSAVYYCETWDSSFNEFVSQ
ncbi:hypothetical protein ABVT39_014060 [Epinephelus coioides]